MKNKQPYYHRMTVLFTATSPIPKDLVEEILVKAMKKAHAFDVQIEEYEDPEPGDPTDLM